MPPSNFVTLVSFSNEAAVRPLTAARQFYVLAFAAVFLTLTIGVMPVFAGVLVSINKNMQQMSVSVDGLPRYRFAVSTGRAGYGTPNGCPYRKPKTAGEEQRIG
jgi:hypothetical protein